MSYSIYYAGYGGNSRGEWGQLSLFFFFFKHMQPSWQGKMIQN